VDYLTPVGQSAGRRGLAFYERGFTRADSFSLSSTRAAVVSCPNRRRASPSPAAACPCRPSRGRLPHPPSPRPRPQQPQPRPPPPLPHPPPPPPVPYRPRAAPNGRPATASPLPDPAAAAIASRPTPPPSVSSTAAHRPDRLSKHRRSPKSAVAFDHLPECRRRSRPLPRAPLPPCR
jgi:hypothetical protein